MGKDTPVPDADTLGRISWSAASTARHHLQAAERLLHCGDWGEAHAMAVVAFEEAGKACLCVTAMLSPDEQRQEFRFSDLGWDHLWKLGAAHSILALLAFVRGDNGAPPSVAEAVADLEILAREDNMAKQRGLYTDYVDGVVRSPADVTEEQARTMAARVEDVLDNAGPLIDLATALWARDNLSASLRSALMQATDAAQAGNDAMAILMQGRLQSTEPLAGMLTDDCEWVCRILAIAHQLDET